MLKPRNHIGPVVMQNESTFNQWVTTIDQIKDANNATITDTHAVLYRRIKETTKVLLLAFDT